VADTRSETNSFVPPDSRSDTSSSVLQSGFQIVDSTGAVVASDSTNTGNGVTGDNTNTGNGVTADNTNSGNGVTGDKTKTDDSTAPIVKASYRDDTNTAPEGERSAPEAKPVDRMFDNVEKFAFDKNGDSFFNEKEGKQSLEALAQLANMSGPNGLNKLTDALNQRATDQYGNAAFDASDPKVADKMEGNAVQMDISNRTANSMDVQFNFLVPNSNEIRSHKFKLDTTPGQAPYPVFDRTVPV